jgi:hypothetical protein
MIALMFLNLIAGAADDDCSGSAILMMAKQHLPSAFVVTNTLQILAKSCASMGGRIFDEQRSS